MTNKMRIILVAAIVIFGTRGISFAMSCCSDMSSKGDSGKAYTRSAENGSKAIDVGNKVCPVTGETIIEDTKATYEYNGKIYNFCCSMCIPKFKQDPKKYSVKAEQSANR